MFPLPNEPYEALNFKSEIKPGDTFQNASLETLHPAETEGKNAYRSFSGNFFHMAVIKLKRIKKFIRSKKSDLKKSATVFIFSGH